MGFEGILRQSTAVDILFGPLVDDTDAATAEEALTPNVFLSKNGQTMGDANDGDASHDDAGYYNVELDATDTNTLGLLKVTFEADGTALPHSQTYMVVPGSVYDAYYGATHPIAGLIIYSGTIGATGNDTTHLHLDGTAGYADDDLNGYLLGVVDDSTGLTHYTWITDYANSGDLATVETLPFTPEASTDRYTVLGIRRDVKADSLASIALASGVDVTSISGDSGAADNLEAAFDGTGYDLGGIDVSELNTAVDAIGSDGTGLTEAGGDGDHLTAIDLPNQTMDISGTITTATNVTNQVTADVTAISGDSNAADALEALMDGTIVAQVNDGSATTTDFAADGFTEATDDHFNGRLITFITGNLSGQQTDITDYDAADGAQGSQQFTVTALTEAPANDDYFVIH